MKLRPYQAEAVESAFQEWETNNSTLIVSPTGTGKTQIFCEVIKRTQPGRAMVLAHRGELISQAVKRLAKDFGIYADIEMADQYANEHEYGRSSVVVATVQTLNAGNNGNGRMKCFNPDDFELVIADEAHHYTAPSFKRVLDYFRQNKSLKVLGVTATPDRADEEALGQVFESVAYDYEILDAIQDGWLVPVEQQMIQVQSLDYSGIKTSMGDLNTAELASVMEMEKNLHGIASSSLDIIKDGKKTLVFTVSVKQAEMLAEIYNRHKPGIAYSVNGQTPKHERYNLLQDFNKDRFQILVNVGVLTEGFDEPSVEVIVQARPTKSRCLYAQIIGRALRPLPGVVDPFETTEERHEAIAMSAKTHALVLDFVGNAGRHKLMTTADILGGKVSDEAIEMAVEKAKREGTPVRMDLALEEAEKRLKEIEEARQREAARKAHLMAQATYSSKQIDPFNLFHLTPAKARGWDRAKKITEKQAALLRKNGINPDTISFTQAKQVIGELMRRWDNHLCTTKMCNTLAKYGYDGTNMTFEDASHLIDRIAKNGWRRPDV